jgi:hypothetical protein
MSQDTILKLANTPKGTISIKRMEEPYGKDSATVASIGISLKGKGDPEWKVHIPLENVEEVILALQKIK